MRQNGKFQDGCWKKKQAKFLEKFTETFLTPRG